MGFTIDTAFLKIFSGSSLRLLLNLATFVFYPFSVCMAKQAAVAVSHKRLHSNKLPHGCCPFCPADQLRVFLFCYFILCVRLRLAMSSLYMPVAYIFTQGQHICGNVTLFFSDTTSKAFFANGSMFFL